MPIAIVVAIVVFGAMLWLGHTTNVVSDRAVAWYVCVWVGLLVVGRLCRFPGWGYEAAYFPVYAILFIHVNGEDPVSTYPLGLDRRRRWVVKRGQKRTKWPP